MTAPLAHSKQKKLINRLSRVSGQVNAIKAMVESDEGCTDIAMQLSAARRALDKAYFEMMACAIEREVSESIDDDWQEQLDTLTTTLAKYA